MRDRLAHHVRRETPSFQYSLSGIQLGQGRAHYAGSTAALLFSVATNKIRDRHLFQTRWHRGSEPDSASDERVLSREAVRISYARQCPSWRSRWFWLPADACAAIFPRQSFVLCVLQWVEPYLKRKPPIEFPSEAEIRLAILAVSCGWIYKAFRLIWQEVTTWRLAHTGNSVT